MSIQKCLKMDTSFLKVDSTIPLRQGLFKIISTTSTAYLKALHLKLLDLITTLKEENLKLKLSNFSRQSLKLNHIFFPKKENSEIKLYLQQLATYKVKYLKNGTLWTFLSATQSSTKSL